MYESTGFETVLYKRLGAYTASSNAEGKIAIAIGPEDPDNTTAALTIKDASAQPTID